MKKWILVFGLISFFLGHHAYAQKLSPQECEAIASGINETVPSRIDRITILTNTYCLTFGGKIEFRYRNELSERLQINRLPLDFKRKVKNSFCTGPETSLFLDSVDAITYEYYYSSDGQFFDSFSFGKQDC